MLIHKKYEEFYINTIIGSAAAFSIYARTLFEIYFMITLLTT